MEQICYYKVAELVFSLDFGHVSDMDKMIDNYTPFCTEKISDLIFHIKCEELVDEAPSLLSDWILLSRSEGGGLYAEVYQDAEGCYHYLHMTSERRNMWMLMDISHDLSGAVCRVQGSPSFKCFMLSSAAKLMFVLNSVMHNTLMFHSSVIKYKGRAYMFLGKSGTGKSTHAKLWLQYVEGSELLNDDTPLVRVIDDKIWVYGAPWSGKTPCYKNECAELGSFARLWQASENRIRKLSVLEAYAALKPSVSGLIWNKEQGTKINDLINIIINKVSVFCLWNRPEKETALMSFDALVNAI